jgi:3-methyladenine DNA glycosylase/8-oxoguanine DNA glycosylase
VRDAVGSDFTADQIAAISPDTASACGLSRAKYEALLDLATRTQNGHVRFHQHGRMTDEQVLAELVQVRGIGPWTAQMYLMNNLARPDIWPHLDYGVRHGLSLLHGYPDMISIKELATAADHLTPFRSSVAWYCWRAVDLAREQGR